MDDTDAEVLHVWLERLSLAATSLLDFATTFRDLDPLDTSQAERAHVIEAARLAERAVEQFA